MSIEDFSLVDKSLIEEVQNSADLKSIADELAELALDSFLDEGVAKNIPVVTIFRSLQKASSSFSDYLLTKKIIEFLRGIGSVPLVQRQKQINKLIENAEYGDRLGENLMLLFERLNDMGKPAMVAKAWKAYLEERIDAPMLFDLLAAIEAIRMPLIPVLLDIYEKGRSPVALRHVENNWWAGGIIEPPGSSNEQAPYEDWDRMQQLARIGLLSMFFGGRGGMHGEGGLRACKLGRFFDDVLLMDREKVRP